MLYSLDRNIKWNMKIKNNNSQSRYYSYIYLKVADASSYYRTSCPRVRIKSRVFTHGSRLRLRPLSIPILRSRRVPGHSGCAAVRSERRDTTCSKTNVRSLRDQLPGERARRPGGGTKCNARCICNDVSSRFYTQGKLSDRKHVQSGVWARYELATDGRTGKRLRRIARDNGPKRNHTSPSVSYFTKRVM